MTKHLLATALLCCCLIACGDDAPPDDGGGTETLRLTAERAGDDLAYCDASGYCESYPNPGGCKTLTITIDTASGKSCETCENDDGSTERCGDTSVACQIIKLPEPDCVVCAYINGDVIYSSCNPPDEDTCADVMCPAIYPVCPDGQEPRRDPNDCCGYTCPPVSCDNVLCAAFMACPPGTETVIAPGDCCGTCIPQTCNSSSECPKYWHCTVDDGECLPCNAPEGAACTTVCRGICSPNVVID
ncbi:MAG: hypothetical protein ACAI38_19770 [Myxococcota bacterium]